MSLKRLSNQEMVQLGSNLLDPGEDPRRIIDALETGAGLISMIRRANEGLILAQPPSSSEIEALTNELARLDVRHDDLVRALDARLESEFYATTDENLRAAIALARRALLPAGRSIIQASYRAQAGETKLREGRVSEEDRKLLEKLETLEGETHEGLFRELQAVGAEMGQLHKRREQLGKEGEQVLKTNDARYAWIRAINAVEAVLIGEGIDPEKVLGEIYRARADAARREARRAAAATDDESGDDVTTGGDETADTEPEERQPAADLDPPVPTDDDEPSGP